VVGSARDPRRGKAPLHARPEIGPAAGRNSGCGSRSARKNLIGRRLRAPSPIPCSGTRSPRHSGQGRRRAPTPQTLAHGQKSGTIILIIEMVRPRNVHYSAAIWLARKRLWACFSAVSVRPVSMRRDLRGNARQQSLRSKREESPRRVPPQWLVRNVRC
jgi:hypothetical protein